MISVEDWALIRRLVADGVPRRQVARAVGDWPGDGGSGGGVGCPADPRSAITVAGISSARNASGAQLRIRAAAFPARKTLEDFDFDAQPAIRTQIGALASGAFLTEARNIVLLGPPGTGKIAPGGRVVVRERPAR